MDVKFALMFVNYLSVAFSKLELRLLKHNTALEGSTFLTLQGISLQECWENCENRPRCSSINYRRLMHLCQLNHGFYGDKSVLTTTVQKKGSVFYRKEVSQLGPTQCDSIECSDRTVCDKTTTTCLFKECPPATSLSDSYSVRGNMVSVGDKILQECKVGFIPASGTNATVTSQCGKYGEWMNQIVCTEQLDCCNGCTMRPSATDTSKFQWIVHGEWKDRDCPNGTYFNSESCGCDNFTE